MQAFTQLTSSVIPLPLKDVDTDMIIPAQYLTLTSKSGYGDHLFTRLREQDKDFVFNQPRYQDAEILLSGENFGCGSSREHAVWALLQHGIKVVIAESFSDIFFNNSAKNGLLLVALPKSSIDDLQQKVAQAPITLTLDLETQTVVTPSETLHFDYDIFRKECLLKGHDDFDYLLQTMSEIDVFDANRDLVWE